MQHSQKLFFFLSWLYQVSANLAVLSPFCFFPFENFNFNKPSLFFEGRAASREKADGTGMLILSKLLPPAASQPLLSRDTDPAGLIKEGFYFSVLGNGNKTVLIHLIFFQVKAPHGMFPCGVAAFSGVSMMEAAGLVLSSL